MDLLIGIGIFILALVVIEGSFITFRTIRNPEKKQVRRRIRALSSTGYQDENIDILQKRLISEVPWLNRVLLSIPGTVKLHRLLEQAGVQRPLGFFILLSLLLFFGGFLFSSRVESEGGAQPRLETQHATRSGTPRPVVLPTSRRMPQSPSWWCSPPTVVLP